MGNSLVKLAFWGHYSCIQGDILSSIPVCFNFAHQNSWKCPRLSSNDAFLWKLSQKGNPLQYSCLENSLDRVTWQATVHGFAQSRTTHLHLLQAFCFPEESVCSHCISTSICFCLFKIILMWTIFKVFIEFCYNIASVVYVLVFWPPGMWEISFLTRDLTHSPLHGKAKS